MRKIVLSVNITLDGFMAGMNGELDWHVAHWSSELMENALDQLRNTDTLLIGRNTYQQMASYWPVAATKKSFTLEDREFAERMNVLPKMVFSRTLNKVEWQNAKLVKGEAGTEVKKLKQQAGKDILVWGGIGLVSSFIDQDLFDEYRVSVIPVFLGKGRSVSDKISNMTNLKLLNTRIFANGVVLLTYRNNNAVNCEDLMRAIAGKMARVKT